MLSLRISLSEHRDLSKEWHETRIVGQHLQSSIASAQLAVLRFDIGVRV